MHSKEVERQKKERERDKKKEGVGRKEGRLYFFGYSQLTKSTCHENVSYRTIKIDKKTRRIFPKFNDTVLCLLDSV